jgi:hypothetical protein
LRLASSSSPSTTSPSATWRDSWKRRKAPPNRANRPSRVKEGSRAARRARPARPRGCFGAGAGRQAAPV